LNISAKIAINYLPRSHIEPAISNWNPE